jgi:hypothetical protein
MILLPGQSKESVIAGYRKQIKHFQERIEETEAAIKEVEAGG